MKSSKTTRKKSSATTGEHLVLSLLHSHRATFLEEVHSVPDLLVAEVILDDLDSRRLGGTGEYQQLMAQANAFLRANPSVYMEPWIRGGGAIHDLIEELRQEYYDTHLDCEES